METSPCYLLMLFFIEKEGGMVSTTAFSYVTGHYIKRFTVGSTVRNILFYWKVKQ